MGLRTRSSPKKTLSESADISIKNDDESDVEVGENSSKLKKYLKVIGCFILVSSILALVFYLGSISARNDSMSKSSSKTSSSSMKNKLDLKIHWSGDEIKLLNEGNKDSDVCILMSECFKSNHFAPDPIKYPKSPLQKCYNTMKYIMNTFDSGLYYNGPRLIGFISAETKNYDEYGKVILYNVCVRSEERGKGIAKKMIPEFLKVIIDRKILKTSPKIYVGLDVDFDTETAVSAFALYAKMGFNRWWEPCHSISYFNFDLLERQHDLANPLSSASSSTSTSTSNPPRLPSFAFPMSEMILSRSAALKKKALSPSGVPYSHYCMLMLMGSDDFGSIGADIKESVKSALASKKVQ